MSSSDENIETTADDPFEFERCLDKMIGLLKSLPENECEQSRESAMRRLDDVKGSKASTADGDYASHLEAVKQLDEANLAMKKLDVRNVSKKEALLIRASEMNYVDTIDRLIKSKVNIDCVDGDMETPLMIAVQKSHNRIVEKLLRAGADPNITHPYFNATALHYACEIGNLEATKLLFQYTTDVNVNSHRGTPIIYAVKKDNHRIVEHFLENGYDLNSKNDQGSTLLHTCAQHNSYKTAELLLERGATVDVLDNDNITPVALACWDRAEQVLRLLLKRGADVNLKCDEMMTPVHWACHTGKINMLKLLLSFNVDVTCKDGDNETGLDIAKEQNFPDIVELLENYQSQKQ